MACAIASASSWVMRQSSAVSSPSGARSSSVGACTRWCQTQSRVRTRFATSSSIAWRATFERTPPAVDSTSYVKCRVR